MLIRLIPIFIFIPLVLAQEIVDPDKPATEFPPTVTIERKDKVITAVKYGPDEKGFNIICVDEEKDLTTTIFYDILPYRVNITIDKNIIRAPIAIVKKKASGDGYMEAYDGTATEAPDDSDVCLPTVKPDPKPGTVLVTQGKTNLKGSKIVYDESDGLAIISGPIEFDRVQEKDNLKGTSERIIIEVDNEKTFLEGNVILNTKCRTSNADRVEYDDNKNLAVLFGNPAVSKDQDGGEIKGKRLEYNLDTNEVVVISENGKVVGKFNDKDSTCK